MNTPELIFSDVLTYVDKAEKLLAEGKTHALQTLDATVDDLVEQLKQLTSAEIDEYAPEIEHLLERMKNLTQTMSAERNKAYDTLKSVTKHHHAAKAYLSAPITPNTPET